MAEYFVPTQSPAAPPLAPVPPSTPTPSLNLTPPPATKTPATAAPTTTPPADIDTTGVADGTGNPSLIILGWGTGILLVTWLIAAFAIKDGRYPPTGPTTPVAGLTIVAVFFVAAQAIERLLEPFANYFDPQTGAALQDATDQADTAAKKIIVAKHTGAVPVAGMMQMKSDLHAKLKDAAQKKADNAKSKANRTVIFWAIASGVGVLASSALKLYLLRTVGIATPNRPLEVLATGLIIGSGTQPLHDLVGLISAKAGTTKAAGGS